MFSQQNCSSFKNDIHYLQRCINFEIKNKGRLSNFILLYFSTNQCQDNFESFVNNLGTIDVTTYECSKTDGLNYQFVLQQKIKNAFTFLVTVRLFVLIFTTHQNSVMESGVHSSLHSNCHHYITFAKSNLKIYYTPSYERHVWYY